MPHPVTVARRTWLENHFATTNVMLGVAHQRDLQSLGERLGNRTVRWSLPHHGNKEHWVPCGETWWGQLPTWSHSESPIMGQTSLWVMPKPLSLNPVPRNNRMTLNSGPIHSIIARGCCGLERHGNTCSPCSLVSRGKHCYKGHHWPTWEKSGTFFRGMWHFLGVTVISWVRWRPLFLGDTCWSI